VLSEEGLRDAAVKFDAYRSLQQPSADFTIMAMYSL